ncbi:hypothetical protein VTJ04DRAFT_3217 [Mycothermus thermophilus]|uniref:uncharacterized protein n=1 Tax=Humicola insolens TaxID=85995 RepID=UPI003744453A
MSCHDMTPWVVEILDIYAASGQVCQLLETSDFIFSQRVLSGWIYHKMDGDWGLMDGWTDGVKRGETHSRSRRSPILSHYHHSSVNLNPIVTSPSQSHSLITTTTNWIGAKDGQRDG